MAQADIVLAKVYKKLGIQKLSNKEKYKHVENIVSELQKINERKTIHVKVTGTISERLCELALIETAESSYFRLPKSWQWMADFYVTGCPLNLLISVKSFTAKERLMSSGSGNLLSPSVGWGLFNDIEEWSISRVQAYLYRSFIAIYVPSGLYEELSKEVKDIKNPNNKKFIRKIASFQKDIDAAIIEYSNPNGYLIKSLDIQKF